MHYVAFIATVYINIAVVAALVVQPLTSRSFETLRIYLAWLIATPLIMIGGYGVLAVLALAILILALGPTSVHQRPGYYIALLPMVPAHTSIDLQGFGLDNLLTVDQSMLCGLSIFFIPAIAYFMRTGSAAPQSSRTRRTVSVSTTDIIVVVLTFYISLADARGLPATSALRGAVINIMGFLVPYFAISRWASSVSDIRHALNLLISTTLILSCISIVIQIKRWDFYTLVAPEGGAFVLARYGLIRSSTLVQGPLLGWLAAISVLALFYLRKRESITMLRIGIILFIFTLATMFTLSRAAILTFVAGLMLAVTAKIFRRFPSGAMLVFLSVGGFAAFIYTRSVSVESLDQFGTFAYRVQLIDATLATIADSPIFGAYNFLDSVHLKHMVQGQGIIDIVNVYFQMALSFGLIGLALYLGMFLTSLWPLMRALGGHRKAVGEKIDTDLHGLILIMVVGTLSFLLMIGTTSNVGYVANFGVFWVGLSRAVGRTLKSTHASSMAASGARTA
jgi:hypothetical protein